MTFPIAHAKPQRREAIWVSKRQLFFAALRLCVIFFLLPFPVAAQTNALSDAEIQGRRLARQLCDARPTENSTNTGIMKVRGSKGGWANFPISFEIVVTPTNWQSIYYWSDYAHLTSAKNLNFTNSFTLEVKHGATNQYLFTPHLNPRRFSGPSSTWDLNNEEIMDTFNNSDFFIADLGLEFFHWPAQKILPKTTNLKRGRDYTLLESTNPNPSTNGYTRGVPDYYTYSRVQSWIDKETGGILEAEAYDAQGKLLKVFEPKSFKKVNGQWELQEMEIRNVQTGSRTRLEFDLTK